VASKCGAIPKIPLDFNKPYIRPTMEFGTILEEFFAFSFNFLNTFVLIRLVLHWNCINILLGSTERTLWYVFSE